MAIKVLDDNGLSYFFNKIKSRLLPRASASDSGKIAKVNSGGSWVLASSSEFKGDTGVGFASGTVDGNYHLILTKTDGTTSDAGYVRGLQGEPGSDYILTSTDKSDIAALTLGLLTAAEEVSF